MYVLLLTTTAAVRVPLAVGVKVTVIVQFESTVRVVRSAAQSGTLTGNRIVDRGVGALPINAAIDGINQFPSWARSEVGALPAQFAPVDSWVANTIP